MKNRFFSTLLFIPMTLGVFAMASCSPSSQFLTSYSENPSLAILEAISWDAHSSSDETFVVNVMVANLYFGKSSTGDIVQLVGPYDFTAIEIALIGSLNGKCEEFTVDATDYSRQENGIPMEKAKTASPSDFKLVYSFDLTALYRKSAKTEEELSFSISYTERLASGNDRVFSRRFETHAKVDGRRIHLSDPKFEYSYRGD